MLKIKDNINPKELGFEKDKEDLIWQDDWGLMFDTLHDRIVIPLFDFDKALDRLYDLIQAGYVEKVEK